MYADAGLAISILCHEMAGYKESDDYHIQYQDYKILTGSPMSSKAWTSILNASSAPG